MHDFAKQLEHAGLILFVDADASVVDFKFDCVDQGHVFAWLFHFQFGLFRAHLDVPIEGELSRIPEYVDQYLLQPRVVTFDHLGGVCCHWLHQKDIRFQSQLHIDQLVDFSDDLADVDWLEIHRKFACLQLGEVKRIID